MKINVGCGKNILDGWINVDIQAHPLAKRAPDLLCDARTIPIESESASELFACHLIEHFYLWEVPDVLKEWRRLLRIGGKLILELPNIELCAKNLLAKKTDQMSMWGFFGDPGHSDPYMCHHWGYTPITIRTLLTQNGFDRVVLLRPQTHKSRADRDMRVEAHKAA